MKELKFDDDFLLDSARKRFDEGDLMGALTILNKRELRNGASPDGYALYADVYEEMELWPLAADAWFRFLDTCAREEFYDGYEGLAIAVMNMGNRAQSDFYFRLAVSESDLPDFDDFPAAPASPKRLRLVHDADAAKSAATLMSSGIALLNDGNIAGAREVFREISTSDEKYATSMGLVALCSLMLGDEEEAERLSKEAAERFPENVQVLVSYCAVLGAKGDKETARKVAKHLATLENVQIDDDLYRIATALCETGLHEEAYEKLELLRKRLPYDENILWFCAVAAYHVQKTEVAIDCLETLTTIFPRKEVALRYLYKLRRLRDEGEPLSMNYFYRLTEEDYRALAADFLAWSKMDTEDLEEAAQKPAFAEAFRLAFDETEGRDLKMQLLAVKTAVRGRADALVRSVLLDRGTAESVKVAALHDLICRNEEDSYGIVLLDVYREVFVHELRIEGAKRAAFLTAFADVYSRFALLGETSEEKLCNAGEDVYLGLIEAEAYPLLDARAEVAATIYREAHIKHGERTIAGICALFDAEIVKRILNFVM